MKLTTVYETIISIIFYQIEENLPKNTGLLDHSQVQLYCAEGLAESEACNDVEMQALFLILVKTL